MKGAGFLSVILFGTLMGVGYFVWINNPETPKKKTYEVLFQVLGKPLKTIDRTITRILNVSDEEEAKLGERLAIALKSSPDAVSSKTQSYLQGLLHKMARHHNPKNLKWIVFVYQGEPNAYALPGGIISISTGLLKILETEAELVSVLAHEKGHIDLSHCIDIYRMQAKQQKWSLGNIAGEVFSAITRVFLRHSYRKYEENEADQYAFETLVSMGYNPLALSSSFEKLQHASQPNHSPRHGTILTDYLQSHPSLKIRIDHWKQKALEYQALYPRQRFDDVFLKGVIERPQNRTLFSF